MSLPYAGCNCCECVAATELHGRGRVGDYASLFGFLAFTQATQQWNWYRSNRARGLARYQSQGAPVLTKVDRSCSFTGRDQVSGSNSARVGYWSATDFAFIDQGASPYDSGCVGQRSFEDTGYAAQTTSAVRQLATYGTSDTGMNRYLPQGEAYLYNLISASDWRALGLAELGDWDPALPNLPSGPRSELVLPSSTGTWTYLQTRFRVRFMVPRSGTGISHEVSVMWHPAGGTPELYDTIKWQWDRAVPENYAENDEASWPASPWYELPFPTEAGAYYVQHGRTVCGRSTEPAKPGAVSGRVIA